jgi:hypothetical protein
MKETTVDKIEIVDNTIGVRRATYIFEDGVRIAGPTFQRVCYMAGSDLSDEDPKVQAIAKVIWD